MSAEEETHIDKVGRERFTRAFDYAQLETRRDSHFAGLEKLRIAIAYEAALRATGFRERPLQLSRIGRNEPETQQIAESILERATTLACRALEVLP
jgi:hypothetical protein